MIKYNNYKSSGVEWIGDIPEHWGKYRLKNISISVNGYSFKSDDFDREYDIPVIRIGDVGDIIDFEDCIKVKSKFLEEKKDFIVKKNDILIGLTGGTIGKSGRYNYETPSLLNQRVGLLRNKKEVLNGLLYHYVKSEVFIRYIFYDCYGGGQDNISMNDILNMVFPLPPLQEQEEIVQFLDEKTELIDKLISTKERKISLLKEQRTSLINQVVTKGLNPNVKMKDSGLEWIGEIPVNWRFIKFSYLISKSDLGGNYESSTEGDGVPLMKMGNLGRGKIVLNKIEYLNSEYVYDVNHKLEYGDFLFNTRNSVDLVGKVSLWRNELDFSLYNSNILRISFKNGVDNEFMCYLFNSQSILDVLKLISKGTTSVSGIYYKDLSEVKICIPSIEEQLKIVEHLDSKTKEIDDLVQLEQKKIDLLKEYRQSLISEVVTGKIKVTTDE